jgi:hypothetical protein
MSDITKEPSSLPQQHGGPNKGENLHETWVRYSGSWKHRLIDTLIEYPDLAKDPRYIAKAAGLSLEVVFEVIDDLITIGTVTKASDGSFTRTKSFVNVEKIVGNNINNLENYAKVATEIVSRLTHNGPCEFQHAILTTSVSAIQKYVSDMNKAMADLIESSKISSPEITIGVSNSSVRLYDNSPSQGENK